MNREDIKNINFKPYRIKHIPSGLYFSPRSNSGNNLTRRGKIYTTKVNGFSPTIYLRDNSFAIKVLRELGYKETIPIYPYSSVKFDLPEEEFEKEYL